MASRGSWSKTFLRPKNGVRTTMGTGGLSGFDLSMGYDGELGIDGSRIAASARELTTFFCSCCPRLRPWQRAGLDC